MRKSAKIIKKIVELEDEIQLRKRLLDMESRCLEKQIDLIMKATRSNKEEAYNLLVKYKDIWEFTNNVTTSGDSLVITLPKKEAKQRGIKKGVPVLVGVKRLKFFGR